jgi:uncharacterized protein
MRGLAALAVAAAVALAPAAWAQAPVSIPKFEARVTDLTGTLTAEQQASLEQKLAAFEARKGSQLALLIIPTTQPDAIEQYSIRVVDAWKLGRKKPEDGVLLLVAKDDRALRIEVGRGLEGALTDITSKRIIAETITPLFRQGDFYGGINAGFDQIIRVVDGEPLPPPDEQWQRGRGNRIQGILPFLLVAVFVGSGILRAVFGRGIGSAATGGAIGFIAWVATQALGFAVVAGILALIASLFLGAGGNRWTSGGLGGWGGGGFGGGLGGGGFGGGGFGGGGGGGFSGGGASGRW